MQLPQNENIQPRIQSPMKPFLLKTPNLRRIEKQRRTSLISKSAPQNGMPKIFLMIDDSRCKR